MSFEITGKLIVKNDTQQVSDSFRKREFVLELEEEINGNVYTNFAKMQLVQNKCDIIDNFNEGDVIKVNFNVKGNKWERDGKVNYFTNLDAWRIEHAQNAQPEQAPASPAYTNVPQNNAPQQGSNANYNPSPESADDLPF